LYLPDAGSSIGKLDACKIQVIKRPGQGSNQKIEFTIILKQLSNILMAGGFQQESLDFSFIDFARLL